MTTEHERAAAWRISRNLTQQALGELTGYARETIYWMERGQAPSSQTGAGYKARPVAPWVWQRFKMACAGVDAQLRAGKPFDWGETT